MGSGFIIEGRREPGAGDVTNWLDNPTLRLKRGEDFTARKANDWVRVIVIHTTKGLMGGAPLPAFGPSVNAGERCSRYWSRDGRNAGAHLVVDHDGAISQCVDLRAEAAFHCPGWNHCSIGIEIYQGREGELYEGQLDVTVRLCDWLTRRFGIQRQIPHRHLGALRRFLDTDGDGGHDRTVVGIIGHRDAARNRGPGDPGSAIFNRLGGGGYEPVNFDLREDLELWRRRQRELGVDADGVPGPKTVEALRAAGRPAGLWVERPGDRDPVA